VSLLAGSTPGLTDGQRCMRGAPSGSDGVVRASSERLGENTLVSQPSSRSAVRAHPPCSLTHRASNPVHPAPHNHPRPIPPRACPRTVPFYRVSQPSWHPPCLQMVNMRLPPHRGREGRRVVARERAFGVGVMCWATRTCAVTRPRGEGCWFETGDRLYPWFETQTAWQKRRMPGVELRMEVAVQ
jgi:hypothetical protein